MILMILEDVEQVSSNYHSGGGLNVIAEDIPQAMQLVAKEAYVEPTEEEWLSAKIYVLDPLLKYKPTVYVFPDAGCC